jgi:hypothetical protein
MELCAPIEQYGIESLGAAQIRHYLQINFGIVSHQGGANCWGATLCFHPGDAKSMLRLISLCDEEIKGDFPLPSSHLFSRG